MDPFRSRKQQTGAIRRGASPTRTADDKEPASNITPVLYDSKLFGNTTIKSDAVPENPFDKIQGSSDVPQPVFKPSFVPSTGNETFKPAGFKPFIPSSFKASAAAAEPVKSFDVVKPLSAEKQPFVPAPLVPSAGKQPFIPSASFVPTPPVPSAGKQPFVPSVPFVPTPLVPSAGKQPFVPSVPFVPSTAAPFVPSGEKQPFVPSSVSFAPPSFKPFVPSAPSAASAANPFDVAKRNVSAPPGFEPIPPKSFSQVGAKSFQPTSFKKPTAPPSASNLMKVNPFENKVPPSSFPKSESTSHSFISLQPAKAPSAASSVMRDFTLSAKRAMSPKEQYIMDLWKSIGLEAPEIPMAKFDTLSLITLSDKNTTVFKFMDSEGRTYLAARSKCQPCNDTDVPYYKIDLPTEASKVPLKIVDNYNSKNPEVKNIYENIVKVVLPKTVLEEDEDDDE